jgi:preprotein translocase subunit SecG
MNAIFIILAAILILLCVVTVAMILMQKKRDAGFGGTMTGQGGARNAYYDTNKGRTLDGMLERYTKVAFVIVLVLTVVITIITG